MKINCVLNDYAGIGIYYDYWAKRGFYEKPKKQVTVMNSLTDEFIKIKIDDRIIELKVSELKKAIDNCINF